MMNSSGLAICNVLAAQKFSNGCGTSILLKIQMALDYFTIKGWEPTVKECSFILLVQVLSHHLMPLQGKKCFLLLNNFLTIS